MYTRKHAQHERRGGYWEGADQGQEGGDPGITYTDTDTKTDTDTETETETETDTQTQTDTNPHTNRDLGDGKLAGISL